MVIPNGYHKKKMKKKKNCCGILCQIINALEIEHFQNNLPLPPHQSVFISRMCSWGVTGNI
jgi:hypothetical protein